MLEDYDVKKLNPRKNLYAEKIDLDKGYDIARKNTKYNADGKAVIASDDEWVEESEWDELYESIKSAKTEEKK